MAAAIARTQPARDARVRTRGGVAGQGAVTGKNAHERVLEIAGRAESFVEIRLRGTLDNLHHRVRELGTDIAEANAFPAGVPAANFDHVLAIHREVARQQIEKEHAKAVDVGAEGGAAALEELGRDIRRRAGELRRGVCVGRTHTAEVHQHDPSAHLAHHVLRLDVAVHQAGTMERRQRAAQIDADPGDLAAHSSDRARRSRWRASRLR